MKKLFLLLLLPLVLSGCQAAKERDSLKVALEQKEQMLLQYQDVINEKSERVQVLEQELTDLSAKLPQSWNEDAVIQITTLNELLDLHNLSLLRVKSSTYYGKLLEHFQLDPQAFILALKPRDGELVQDIVHQLMLHAETVISEQDTLHLYGLVLAYTPQSLKEEYIQNLFKADFIALLSNKGVTKQDLIVEANQIAYSGSYYLHKLNLDLTEAELGEILGVEMLKKEDELTQTVLMIYAITKNEGYEPDVSLDGADIIGLRNGDLTCQVFVWLRSGVVDEIQLYYLEGEEVKKESLSRE